MDVAVIVLIVRLLTDACKKIIPVIPTAAIQAIALGWSAVLTLGYGISILPPAQVPYLSDVLTVAAVWLAAMGTNDLLDLLKGGHK